MSLVCPRHALLGSWRRTARTQLNASFPGAVLVRTFGISPSVLSGTAQHQIYTGIQQRYHRQIAPRLPRLALASFAIVEPTGRRRSAGICSRAAVIRLPPAVLLLRHTLPP